MDTGELSPGNYRIRCTGGSGSSPAHGHWSSSVFAVIIPLLGQAWGNTFGTLAAAWDALAMSTGLVPGTPDYLAAAFWAGVFIWMWNVVIGLVICWFYGKGKAVRKGLPALLILSLIQGGGELLLTRVNTTIACFLPGLSLPGGPDTDRQNEDVQTGVECGGQAGLWTVALRPAHRRRRRMA